MVAVSSGLVEIVQHHHDGAAAGMQAEEEHDAAAALLAACGSNSTDTTAAAQQQQAAPDAAFPRTITHHKGTTEVPQKPQRIVALDNGLVEAVVLLERPLVGGIGSTP